MTRRNFFSMLTAVAVAPFAAKSVPKPWPIAAIDPAFSVIQYRGHISWVDPITGRMHTYWLMQRDRNNGKVIDVEFAPNAVPQCSPPTAQPTDAATAAP